jgi:hypothetical protein
MTPGLVPGLGAGERTMRLSVSGFLGGEAIGIPSAAPLVDELDPGNIGSALRQCSARSPYSRHSSPPST